MRFIPVQSEYMRILLFVFNGQIVRKINFYMLCSCGLQKEFSNEESDYSSLCCGVCFRARFCTGIYSESNYRLFEFELRRALRFIQLKCDVDWTVCGTNHKKWFYAYV